MDDTKKTEAVKVLGRVCQGVALVLMITAIPLMARDGSETLALQVLVTALALLAAGILTAGSRPRRNKPSA